MRRGSDQRVDPWAGVNGPCLDIRLPLLHGRKDPIHWSIGLLGGMTAIGRFTPFIEIFVSVAISCPGPPMNNRHRNRNRLFVLVRANVTIPI